MKENSFESVNSNDFNEKESIDNNDQSLNSNKPEIKIDKNKNTNIINENKNQIRKSIIFSSINTNITNNNDFMKATLTKNNNLISDLTSEQKDKRLNKKESYSNLKFPTELSSLNLNQKKIKQLCLDISDKKNTKITLVKVIDQYYYEGHLKLKNNLKKEYVIFKIINDKPFYSITPTLYYIEPDKEITINIKRFERLTINESKNVYDFLIVVVAHTENKIEDINDAKIYIRKEDLYSPEYQLYTYSISLDYGYNPNVYLREDEERENIFNQYKSQLNMNNINNIEEVKTHIEEVKKQIKEYENKIDNLKSILGDINKKNIIKQEETIFDKEIFNEVAKGKVYKELDEDEINDINDERIPFRLAILYFSICLFIGKFLKYLIWKKK